METSERVRELLGGDLEQQQIQLALHHDLVEGQLGAQQGVDGREHVQVAHQAQAVLLELQGVALIGLAVGLLRRGGLGHGGAQGVVGAVDLGARLAQAQLVVVLGLALLGLGLPDRGQLAAAREEGEAGGDPGVPLDGVQGGHALEVIVSQEAHGRGPGALGDAHLVLLRQHLLVQGLHVGAGLRPGQDRILGIQAADALHAVGELHRGQVPAGQEREQVARHGDLAAQGFGLGLVGGLLRLHQHHLAVAGLAQVHPMAQLLDAAFAEVHGGHGVGKLAFQVQDQIEGAGHVLVEGGVGVLELEVGRLLLMLGRGHGRELAQAREQRLGQGQVDLRLRRGVDPGSAGRQPFVGGVEADVGQGRGQGLLVLLLELEDLLHLHVQRLALLFGPAVAALEVGRLGDGGRRRGDGLRPQGRRGQGQPGGQD